MLQCNLDLNTIPIKLFCNPETMETNFHENASTGLWLQIHTRHAYLQNGRFTITVHIGQEEDFPIHLHTR